MSAENAVSADIGYQFPAFPPFSALTALGPARSDNDYGSLDKNGFGFETAMSSLLDGKGVPFRSAFSALLGRGL